MYVITDIVNIALRIFLGAKVHIENLGDNVRVASNLLHSTVAHPTNLPVCTMFKMSLPWL